MKLNRKSLVEDLKVVYQVVGKDTIIPVFSCFRFCNDKVVASDGFVSVEKKLEMNLEFDILVKADPVVDLLERLPQDEIELEVYKEKLRVVSENILGDFNLVEADSNLIAVKKEGFPLSGKIDTTLVLAMHKCIPVVSRDSSSAALRGVSVRGKYVYATDKLRIIRIPLENDCGLSGKVFRVEFINLLSALETSLDSVVYGDDGIAIETSDGISASSVWLEGEYRDLGEFFPKREDMVSVEFLTPLSEIVDRHLVFQKDVIDVDKAIEIEIDGNLCNIHTFQQETGELFEEVKIDRKMPAKTSFIVNPALFKEILSSCSGFSYSKDASTVLFSDGTFEFIIKPRVS